MVCKECGAYNADHLTHCRVCAAKLRDDAPVYEQEPDLYREEAEEIAEEVEEAVEENLEEEIRRPAREFVKSPSWPKQAFAGARTPAPDPEPAADPEEPEEEPAADDEPAEEPAPKAVFRPSASFVPAAPKPAAPVKAADPEPDAGACPKCGKPAIPGAPFCPYCGASMAAAEEPEDEAEEAPVKPPVRERTSGSERSKSPARAAAAASAAAAAETRRIRTDRKAAESLFDKEFDLSDDEDEFDEDEEEEIRPKRRRNAAAAAASRRHPSRRNVSEFDDEDEDEEEYDEDEDEFDDDEFEPRHSKRSKGGTSFLFWALIILLVALIAVFGIYIIRRNFSGGVSEMFSHLGSAFSSGSKDATETPANLAPSTDSNTPISVAKESNMYTATATPYTDETGKEYFDVNIFAPTGSVVKIISDVELTEKTATIANSDHLILRVPKGTFMPNAPCDSETITVTPNIQVETPSGETIALKIDPITINVPALSFALTEPVTDTVQQTYTNDPIYISGNVYPEDAGAKVTVNGQEVTVYAGGLFTTTYTPTVAPNTQPAAAPAPAPEPAAPADGTAAEGAADPAVAVDAAPAAPAAGSGYETIELIATRENYVTARKVITIQPYVMQSMAISVTNDPSTGLSTTSGSLTLTGTISRAGNTQMTLSSPSDKVKFGEPSIGSDGTFSVVVNMDAVGVYPITIKSTATGYYEGSTSTTVERRPDVKYSTFLKQCTDLAKSYDKVTSGEIVTGNFFATGEITEILATEPRVIYKLHTKKGDVIVENRSEVAKNFKTGQKKQPIGSLYGTYQDTGLPYLLGWFSRNQ